eukprot:1157986-Pelagomonas_calceolata.AAC.2
MYWMLTVGGRVVEQPSVTQLTDTLPFLLAPCPPPPSPHPLHWARARYHATPPGVRGRRLPYCLLWDTVHCGGGKEGGRWERQRLARVTAVQAGLWGALWGRLLDCGWGTCSTCGCGDLLVLAPLHRIAQADEQPQGGHPAPLRHAARPHLLQGGYPWEFCLTAAAAAAAAAAVDVLSPVPRYDSAAAAAAVDALSSVPRYDPAGVAAAAAAAAYVLSPVPRCDPAVAAAVPEAAADLLLHACPEAPPAHGPFHQERWPCVLGLRPGLQTKSNARGFGLPVILAGWQQQSKGRGFEKGRSFNPACKQRAALETWAAIIQVGQEI